MLFEWVVFVLYCIVLYVLKVISSIIYYLNGGLPPVFFVSKSYAFRSGQSFG